MPQEEEKEPFDEIIMLPSLHESQDNNEGSLSLILENQVEDDSPKKDNSFSKTPMFNKNQEIPYEMLPIPTSHSPKNDDLDVSPIIVNKPLNTQKRLNELEDTLSEAAGGKNDDDEEGDVCHTAIIIQPLSQLMKNYNAKTKTMDLTKIDFMFSEENVSKCFSQPSSPSGGRRR